jgi:hypothetical protein
MTTANPIRAEAHPPRRWLAPPFGALVVVGLVVFAALVRLPLLQELPLWTDEGGEVQVGVWIYRDGLPALQNENAYNGPLSNYMLAAWFWLVGMGAWTPRGMALVAGALTVIPTALMARELALASGGSTRVAMGVGGMLLAANAVHIVVNSHVPWGNCVTPLFTTTGCWLLARSFRLGQRLGGAAGWAMVGGGSALGMALQTHPTVLTLGPGVVLAIVWHRWRWLLTPWPYAAGVGFVLGAAPIWLNALRLGRFAWLDSAADKREFYNYDEALGADTIVLRLGRVLHTASASVAGLLNDRDTPMPAWWHPLALVSMAIAIVAVLWLWRRGPRLPALLIVSGVVTLPYTHGQFDPIVTSARYVGFLLPIAFAAIGAWAAVRRERGGHLVPVGIAVAMAVGSLVSLGVFYSAALRDGRDNRELRANYELLKREARPGEMIAVDRFMFRDWTLSEGRLSRVFAFWLELDSRPFGIIEVRPDGSFSRPFTERGGLAVLSRHGATLASQHYDVQILTTQTAPGSPEVRGYTMVRATPRARR